MKGYKGFDKDLKCNGYQFEVGKKFKHKGDVKICKSGFHFCENPLHVMRYYNPARSRFAEVEGEGEIADHHEDSKKACSEITINAEIGLKGLVDAGMKFIFSRIKWGDKDKPQTHGDSSAAQTHGNSSAAQTHGYYSAAIVNGKESIAVSTGIQGKAKGVKGSWLVLSEWGQDENYKWKIKSVQTVQVDGKTIKADTFYQLKDSKFIKCD